MAVIVHEDIRIRCFALAVLFVLHYVCIASTSCQQHCTCSQTSTSNANLSDSPTSLSNTNLSELHADCICPEYRVITMITEHVRKNVLKLQLGYSEPVVLRSGSIQKFSQIRFLNISGTQFVEPGGFQGLETLETLVLHENYMRVLETAMFTDLTNLTTLIVEGTTKHKIHALENGTFLGLKKLTHLNVKDNAITEITEEHFRDLENLGILNFANNKLTQITARTFIYSPKLRQIILSNNYITQIQRYAFIRLTKLKTLSLDGNRIKGMPRPDTLTPLTVGVSNVDSHVIISLDDNPLRCDCHLNWISSWLENNTCYGLCHTPSSFKGKTLEDVYKDGLPQCQQNNSLLSVEPGKQLELTCSFADASWVTPDGRRFQEHGDCEDPFYLTNRDSLVIWKASPEVSGSYTCLSSDGTQASFYKVTVSARSPLSIAMDAGIAAGGLLFLVMTIVFGYKILKPDIPPLITHQDNPASGNQQPDNPDSENLPPQGNHAHPGNPHPGNPHPDLGDVAGAIGGENVPLLQENIDRASLIPADKLYGSIFKKYPLSKSNVNIYISKSF